MRFELNFLWEFNAVSCDVNEVTWCSIGITCVYMGFQ